MSTLKINLANFFAKQSCSAWQKNRIVRKICRDTYRLIMETGAANYPYANSDFADWPESDGDSYTLVTDSCNFVIRHSASYIAWMMKKHCGGWPKLPVPGERKPGEHNFDAKHWNEVLEFNGWQELSEYEWPEMADDIDDTHYIGIMPNEGEFGQLVWLVDATEGDNNTPASGMSGPIRISGSRISHSRLPPPQTSSGTVNLTMAKRKPEYLKKT